MPLCRELGGGGSRHQGIRDEWTDGTASGSQPGAGEDQTAKTPGRGERPWTAAAQRPRRSGKHPMRGRQGRREEEEGEELGRWWRRSRRKEGEEDEGSEGETIGRIRPGKNLGGMTASPRRRGRSLALKRTVLFAPHRCFLLLALAAMQTPLVAGQNCTAGQVCCQIPPCLCGTYIACGDSACTSASVRPKSSSLYSPLLLPYSKEDAFLPLSPSAHTMMAASSTSR